MRGPSIRNYILLIILLMLVIPVTIIIILIEKQNDEALHQAAHLSNDLVIQVSREVQKLLNGTEQLLSSFALIPEVQRRDAQWVKRFCAELVRKTPEVTNLAVADSSGQIWVSAAPLTSPINVSDRRYFINALNTGHISSGEYIIGRILKRPTINFGYPLKDIRGRVTDVALVSINLDFFHERLDSSILPSGTSLVIDDNRGTILFYRPNSEMIGKADKPEIFSKMIAAPSGGSFDAIGISNVERMFAYRTLQLPGETTPYMYIRTGVPLETFKKKERADLLRNVGLLFAGSIITAGLAIVITRKGFLEKIKFLQIAASRVAEGDFSITTSREIIGGELGSLAESFDAMVHRLSDSFNQRSAAEKKLIITYQLMESAKKDWELTFDAVPDLIAILDCNTRVVRCNMAFASRLNSTPSKLVNRHCHEVIHGSDHPVHLCPHAQLKADGKEHRSEMHIPRLGGWFEVTVTPLNDDNGNITGCVHIAHDITERELHRQKHEEYNRRLQGLARSQNFSQERERRRLANLLHDQIGQSLALARIKLGKLTNELQHQLKIDQAKELHNILGQVINETRSLTIEISPPSLYQIGLGAALETLADLFQRKYEFEITIHDADKTVTLNEESRIVVYQSIRELVFNIIKHANVNKCEITFAHKDNKLISIVSDRGCGITTTLPTTDNSFGLFNIREQLTSIGGEMTIHSVPGSGTSVTIEVPVSHFPDLPQANVRSNVEIDYS